MEWPKELKKTGPRKAVLEAFVQQNGALSVSDLSPLLPEIHIATLYRIIESFLNTGILETLDEFQPKEKRFILKTHGHHHTVHCVACGQTQTLSCCPVHLDATIEGYKILSHRLQIEGLCPRCQAQQSSSSL